MIMFAIQFTARYLDDGMWQNSGHVAYFETAKEREQFASLPFVAACRYPDDDDDLAGYDPKADPEPSDLEPVPDAVRRQAEADRFAERAMDIIDKAVSDGILPG